MNAISENILRIDVALARGLPALPLARPALAALRPLRRREAGGMSRLYACTSCGGVLVHPEGRGWCPVCHRKTRAHPLPEDPDFELLGELYP